ncbi:YdcF family protein [Thiomicrolovo sp. ZZH C-3]
MKKWIFVISALLLLLLTGLNLGRFVDVAGQPVKSDIIVCLGGGTVDRVKVSMRLLEEGYSARSVFLLMGESWYNRPYIGKHYPDAHVTIDEGPKNTMEEVVALKKYMQIHGYHSAIIVTDPPHTRRVRVLLSILPGGADDKMTFSLVAPHEKWWDREHYYKNAQARQAVLHEIGGIIYALLCSAVAGCRTGD